MPLIRRLRTYAETARSWVADTVILTRPMGVGDVHDGLAGDERALRKIDEFIREYGYVVNTELSALKKVEQWWCRDTFDEGGRRGMTAANAWLSPFLPVNSGTLPSLSSLVIAGPSGASLAAQELRAQIREHRASGARADDLLRWLYGVCAMADFVNSLRFDGVHPHLMLPYVDWNSLTPVHCDYRIMGYAKCKALSRSDVAWLVQAFGEPLDHQSFNAVYPDPRRNAVSRYCWETLRRSNKAAGKLGMSRKNMRSWLIEIALRDVSATSNAELTALPGH